jgi:type IV secretion system protein TrbL
MIGFTTFFDNIVTVLVLLFAWFVVVLAFFVLAVQLFITILEFKLTSLAGFVLVPFAFWNKSAFLAERVLGNVISSGIKVMVLAVIVGIGAGFFNTFTNALNGQDPSLAQAMSLVLASISLFGIGIFGPAIASGLVAGAPQLGAGAAIGTMGGLAAAGMLAGGAAVGGGRVVGRAGIGAVRAGTALGAGISTAYRIGYAGSGETGLTGAAAGLGGIARAGAGAIRQSIGSARQAVADGLTADAAAGAQTAWRFTGGGMSASSKPPTPGPDSAPAWAQTLRAEQRTRTQAHAVMQAVKEGDKPAAAANPELSEEER